jgi:DNA-directed RNA polymerase subunit F
MSDVTAKDHEIKELMKKCHSIRDNLKKSIDELLEFAKVFEPLDSEDLNLTQEDLKIGREASDLDLES